MGCNISNNLININKSLINLNSTEYDVEKYTKAIAWQTKELEYYYCHLANNGFTNYKLHKKPKVHQLAYINIGRGFPKELMDGHWCYVLKDFGSKMLVIPTVSIKNEPLNEKYEMDIDISINDKKTKSRLQLSDIRTIDIQRIYEKKGYLNVHTASTIIKNRINKLLSD